MCVLQREGQRSRLLSQAAIWLRYDEYVVKGTQLQICGPCGIVNTRSLTCSCWVNIWPSIKETLQLQQKKRDFLSKR